MAPGLQLLFNGAAAVAHTVTGLKCEMGANMDGVTDHWLISLLEADLTQELQPKAWLIY